MSLLWLLIFLLFIALTALRATVSMGLLQTSFHLVFGRPVLLLPGISVIISLRALHPRGTLIYILKKKP